MINMDITARLARVTLLGRGIATAITLACGFAVGNTDFSLEENPELHATVTALSVARHSRSLADTASTRTFADMSPEEIRESRTNVDSGAAEIRSLLDVLANTKHADAAERIRQLLEELILNASQLEDGRTRLARSLSDSQKSRQKLVADTSWQLLPAAVASEDDLFHRVISQSSSRDSQSAHLQEFISVEDLLLYARLALLKQQIDQGYIALEVATRQTDSEFIGTVEEAVNLAIYQLRENAAVLSDEDFEDLDPTLVPLALNLVEAAYGETNLIDQMKTRLSLDEQEAQLAASVDAISSSLQREVHALLADAIAEIESEATESGTAMALSAAMFVSQHVSEAASRMSEVTSVDAPNSDVPKLRNTVNAHISGIREGLQTLDDIGYVSESERMALAVDRIQSTTERILNGRPELADALRSAAQERAQLRSFVDYQLEPAVVSSLDNQLYYMLTGRSESREEVAVESDRLSQAEFLRYWHLASVNESIFRTFSGLIIAIIMTDATWIGVGEERFITASHRLEKSIDFLEQTGGAEVRSELVPLARQFIRYGNGESNVFDSLRHRLPLVANERELMQLNRQVFAELQIDINALIDSILQDATTSS